MAKFLYPARLSRDEDGRVVVEFPDSPFAATDGADVAEALAEASDGREEALAFCISDGESMPAPSRPRKGRAAVAPGPVIAAKAALSQAVGEARLSKVALAERLGVGEKEVRRMLDPRHPTKIPTLDRALAAVGQQVVLEVRDTPAQPVVKRHAGTA